MQKPDHCMECGSKKIKHVMGPSYHYKTKFNRARTPIRQKFDLYQCSDCRESFEFKTTGRNTIKVIVYHAHYGCDTGCCGHRFELVPDEALTDEIKKELEEDSWFYGFDKPADSDFFFWHGEYEEDATKKELREMIIEVFGEEHADDLDWEHCIIRDFSC